MIEKLLLKLRARNQLSLPEERALRSVINDVVEVPAKQTIARRGERVDRATLLIEGMMCRFKDLRSGQRQITALHVPGDFLDLHAFTLKRLDHDIMSLTPAVIAYAQHDKLNAIVAEFPSLAWLLWLTTNLDAAMHREWALSLGQRTGAARAAHLFCELYARLEAVGLADGFEFDLPINQTELGECLGLTVVHTNRVLRELRQQGLARFSRGRVSIDDMEGLTTTAEFDQLYLYLGNEHR
jgi:CRP-like cAMP-binding protein